MIKNIIAFRTNRGMKSVVTAASIVMLGFCGATTVLGADLTNREIVELRTERRRLVDELQSLKVQIHEEDTKGPREKDLKALKALTKKRDELIETIRRRNKELGLFLYEDTLN